jgi:hypothetical protein
MRDDPLSAICACHASIGLTLLGRNDDALLAAKRSLELAPDAFSARLAVTVAKAWSGDLAGALEAAGPALQMSARHPWVLATMTHIFAASGERTRAEAIHQELLARATTGYVQCTWLAMSALALGRVDEAMDFTFRSVTECDAFGPWFLRWPNSEALHAHPRYPELRRMAGL